MREFVPEPVTGSSPFTTLSAGDVVGLGGLVDGAAGQVSGGVVVVVVVVVVLLLDEVEVELVAVVVVVVELGMVVVVELDPVVDVMVVVVVVGAVVVGPVGGHQGGRYGRGITHGPEGSVGLIVVVCDLALATTTNERPRNATRRNTNLRKG